MSTGKCALCSKTCADLLVCARCKVENYCSKKCQVSAWRNGHKRTCLPKDTIAALETLSRLFDAEDWLQMVEHETRWSEVATAITDTRPTQSMFVYHALGIAFQSLQRYAQALECFVLHLEIARKIGNRSQEGRASCNLGIIHHHLGNFGKAIECQKLRLVIAMEENDEAAMSRAYCNLGCTYDLIGDHFKAVRFHKLDLGIQQKIGNVLGESSACGNIGNAMHALGDFESALEWHKKHMAFATGLGDAKGECSASGNIGMVLESSGQFREAHAHYQKQLVLAKHINDRDLQARACANLSTCHIHMHKFEEALGFIRRQQDLALDMQVPHMKTDADMNLGVTLAFQASRLLAAQHELETPAPELHAKIEEALGWLDVAFDGGQWFAKLHSAQLLFAAGDRDAAFRDLKCIMSIMVKCSHLCCSGCGQKRGENKPMLTCGGCRVARFCSVSHQKMASRKFSSGGSVATGRHSDMCAILGQWRDVLKNDKPLDSCDAEILAFLAKRNKHATRELTPRESPCEP